MARRSQASRSGKESLNSTPVLIQFWATWCGYCRCHEPAVERIVAESSDLVVLAVSVNESKAKIRKYLERSPRTPKIVASEDTSLRAVFDARIFPLYVLIGRNGGIVDTLQGAVGYDALKDLLCRV